MRADLTRAVLRRADLRGACLSDARLDGADLRAADFTQIDNHHPGWRDAYQLAGTDLDLADLRGADLREANWQGASLRGAWRSIAARRIDPAREALASACWFVGGLTQSQLIRRVRQARLGVAAQRMQARCWSCAKPAAFTTSLRRR
jgi:hypothetical protein